MLMIVSPEFFETVLVLSLQISSLLANNTICEDSPRTSNNKIKRMRFPTKSQKIVGGEEASPNELPYQILIQTRTTLCGGVLLTPQYILTAAHCANKKKLADFTVIAGAHDIFGTEDTRQSRKVRKVILHPNFTHEERGIRNDLAILKVSKPFTKTKYVKQIALVRDGLTSDEMGLISGWGCIKQDIAECKNNTLETFGRRLKKLKVPIWTDENCKKIFKNFHSPGVVCVGGNYKEGSCIGDSGGPLVVTRKGVKLLVGIASFGLSDGCGCKGVPTGYSNVIHYAQWIREHVGGGSRVEIRGLFVGHLTLITLVWYIPLADTF